MTRAPRDNYEQMRNQMRTHFLDFDQQEMIRKFRLAHDDGFLYIRFLSRMYRIGRGDGIVEWSDDGFRTCTEGDYSESMTIYDVLCCSEPDCALSGEFAPSRSLKGIVQTLSSAGGGSMFDPSAQAFDRNPEGLARACARIGGIPCGRGDVAFQIPLFDFMPLRFSFWQSDEDFPAEINLLWDTNVLAFMHYETLWFAAGHMMHRLRELMD